MFGFKFLFIRLCWVLAGIFVASCAGTPINMLNLPKGCAFCPRCDAAMKICLDQVPQEVVINVDHKAACWVNVKEAFEEVTAK